MTDRSGELIGEIIDGHADDNLQGIINAARQRERTVALKAAAMLKKGDTVRLTGNLSPKYLLGMEGTIDGPAKGDRIPVRLNDQDALVARRFGNPIRVPMSCIESAS